MIRTVDWAQQKEKSFVQGCRTPARLVAGLEGGTHWLGGVELEENKLHPQISDHQATAGQGS